MEVLREDQKNGAHLSRVRRSDEEVISVAPDGTGTELGYRVTDYVRDLEP